MRWELEQEDKKVSNAIALCNGAIATTVQPNKGPELKPTKGELAALAESKTKFDET